MKKKLLALLFALAMAVTPALAAAEPEGMDQVPDWAKDAMLECSALDMLADETFEELTQPVTQEQMDRITDSMAAKLALLGLEPADPDARAVLVDNTRRGVMNAFYQEVSAYILHGVTDDPIETLQNLKVVQGDGTGLALDRVCTLQEALIMGQRLVLCVYDQLGCGSMGLLWKATGNGNTLYLLGTIHIETDELYPVHATLRNALLSSDVVMTEVDFADEEDMARMAELQLYDDGTTLADHISPELHEKVLAALEPLGLTQEQIDSYRAWALASTFLQLAVSDVDETDDGVFPIDLYVQYKAQENNIPLTAVESATFQIEHVMNPLTDEFQEVYLATALDSYLNADGSAGDPEAVEQTDKMMAAWRFADVAGLEAILDKDAIMTSDDEMTRRLFEERDPNMVAFADNFLKSETPTTGFMAVGAGHMVGETGIVQSLKDLGYTVEFLYTR